MAVSRRGGRWHYAFMIDGRRFRGAVPEAGTKREAEEFEAQVRHSVFEGTHGTMVQTQTLRRRGFRSADSK